jgi:hypothetical protein
MNGVIATVFLAFVAADLWLQESIFYAILIIP